jgi:hypothetical protein
MGMVVTTVAIRPEPMPIFCAKPMQFMAKNTISPPPAHCGATARRGQRLACAKAISSITTPAHRNGSRS